MKVYVILVDYADQRPTKVYGVYKQYRTAYQEERRLKKIAESLWGGNQIDTRIVDQEVTE